MTPLDASTPAALFGDSVGDPRALKRAYARLIREHGPEDAPEVFQHIRRLYEEAVAALERAPAAPTPADAADAADEGAWVDERLANLDAAGPAEVIEALTARARACQSAPALLAAGALVEATEPERLAPFLAGFVSMPALSGVAGRVATLALAGRPELVGAPGWSAIVRGCTDAAVRPRLLAGEIHALLTAGRHAEAWERWEAAEAEIRAGDTDHWLGATLRVLRLAGPGLPPATLDRWIDRFGSADLGLADEVADGLCRATSDALAFGAARKDPAVAPALLDQLSDLLFAQPPVRAAMLAALGADPAWRAAIVGLAEAHPGVYSVVLRVLGTLSPRSRALAVWRDTAEPEPHPPFDAGPLGAAYAVDAAGHDESRRAAWSSYRSQNALVTALMLLAFFGFVYTVGALGEAGVASAALPALLTGWMGWRGVRRSKGLVRPDTAERLGWVSYPFEHLRHAILVACRAQGVWIHEAAAAARQDPRFEAAFDELLADPLSDLDVMGPRHIRRAVGPWSAAPDEGEEATG